MKDSKKKMQVFERKCWGEIIRVGQYQKVTNEELYTKVQRETYYRKRKLRLCGHVYRKE